MNETLRANTVEQNSFRFILVLHGFCSSFSNQVQKASKICNVHTYGQEYFKSYSKGTIRSALKVRFKNYAERLSLRGRNAIIQTNLSHAKEALLEYISKTGLGQKRCSKKRTKRQYILY